MSGIEQNDDGGDIDGAGGAPSPLREVIGRWLQYTEAAEDLVHLTHEAFAKTLTEPELFRILDFDSKKIERAEWKAERARREVESGFPNLHAHALLGLFGALECLVEDLFVASIRHNPELLGSDGFARIKLPISAFYGSDAEEKYHLILLEVSRAMKSDLMVGVGKYESLLNLVGLAGAIPRKVRDYIYEGQQVRNVWAHRGGTADARLVQNCPTAGFVIGESVLITADRFQKYMHALHMYGVVITNRHRALLGRRAVISECHGFEGSLAEIGFGERA